MTTTISSESKPTLFPLELLHIFELAADNYDPECEPWINTSVTQYLSPWSKDLLVKLTIVRTCKRWRSVALGLLYHRVYLHRLEQLSKLVETLESNPGHATLVRHIRGYFWLSLNEEGLGESCDANVERLLLLCSSPETLYWRITQWASGDAVRYKGHSMATVIFLGPRTMRSSLFSLRNLSFDIDLNLHHDDKQWDDIAVIDLPNLEDLSCGLQKTGGICALDLVTFKFNMKSLRSVNIGLLPFATTSNPTTQPNGVAHEDGNPAGRVGEDIGAVHRFLEHHGPKLSSFAISPRGPYEEFGTSNGSLEDILKLSPNVESIRFPATALSTTTLATPFRSLRTLGLYVSGEEFEMRLFTSTSESLQRFLTMAANRANFPCLRAVVIHDLTLPNILLTRVGRQRVFDYFLPWMVRFRDMGIDLLRDMRYAARYRPRIIPLITPKQEQWGAWTAMEGRGRRAHP